MAVDSDRPRLEIQHTAKEKDTVPNLQQLIV